MIFGMCSIWVIRRRNVMYLYNKKLYFDQLFHCQSFRICMMSLGELQISFPLFFSPKIHLMTSYPETSTVKKLTKMRFFYYKDILHFFLE